MTEELGPEDKRYSPYQISPLRRECTFSPDGPVISYRMTLRHKGRFMQVILDEENFGNSRTVKKEIAAAERNLLAGEAEDFNHEGTRAVLTGPTLTAENAKNTKETMKNKFKSEPQDEPPDEPRRHEGNSREPARATLPGQGAAWKFNHNWSPVEGRPQCALKTRLALQVESTIEDAVAHAEGPEILEKMTERAHEQHFRLLLNGEHEQEVRRALNDLLQCVIILPARREQYDAAVATILKWADPLR